MKQTLALTFALILFIPLIGQDRLKSEISGFIDDWHLAAANSDQETYFEMIDELGIYIGTDSSEIWTKPAFYEWATPYFNDKKGWSFSRNSRNIYLSDDHRIAWFDELLDYGQGTLRGSGVLINRGDGWRIIHYVLSVPVPNDKYQDVMRVINSKHILSEDPEE